MHIQLENIGKRYGREWIFRRISYEFSPGGSYALLGANGSGKSTLLQIILGAIVPGEGQVLYKESASAPLSIEQAYRHCSFVSPYLDLPEEFSLKEMLDFHFRFKRMRPGFSIESLIAASNLESSTHKSIKTFSSGMKQRVKLALALGADTPVLLLDEPCTNLDDAGIQWYRNMISNYCSKQLLIVASNQKSEYDFCQAELNVLDYKK